MIVKDLLQILKPMPLHAPVKFEIPNSHPARYLNINNHGITYKKDREGNIRTKALILKRDDYIGDEDAFKDTEDYVDEYLQRVKTYKYTDEELLND